MNAKEYQSQKSLKETLFERIESEQVCPYSRMFFQGRECMVWSLWALSIMVGAFAVAVSVFVMTHRQYELYEATHDNFLTFMVEALPYLWFGVFVLMAYAAVYNIRHTRSGYRYPIWIVLVSSITLSFFGGSLLQLFGFGYAVDNLLGKNLDMYVSQEKFEQRLWQNPDEGRLIGQQVGSTIKPAVIVVFEDMSGQRWRMDISELNSRDVELLATEQTVRLMGQAMNKDLHLFHACGAFPWMVSKDVTLEQMSVERQVFIERVYDHVHAARKLKVDTDQAVASTSLLRKSVCSTIAPVKRMPISDDDIF